MQSGQNSTRLSAKVRRMICMHIVHFFTVMWKVILKERRPLKCMLPWTNINAVIFREAMSSLEEDKTSTAELCQVYQSYRSLNWN